MNDQRNHYPPEEKVVSPSEAWFSEIQDLPLFVKVGGLVVFSVGALYASGIILRAGAYTVRGLKDFRSALQQ